ncbi:MAG: right-handed parallel beta-helix repeat-containing protein [Kiloniellales bacterium]|nr:right-handed parallel beta-helix repeat-containing protein [Kiloniellales bacterium]
MRVFNSILASTLAVAGFWYVVPVPTAAAQTATDLDCVGCVGTKELANESIGNQKLQNFSIGDRKLKDGAIGQNKIKDDAIGQKKIKNRAIGSLKLKLGAVATENIQDGAVTQSKLSPEVQALLGGGSGGGGVVPVNCAVDDLQAVLDNAAQGSTLFLSGTCVGAFTVATDGITLSGNEAAVACNPDNPSLSAGATIDGSVTVRSVSATLEHLIVTGAGNGVHVHERATATLRCNAIQNNVDSGLLVTATSHADIADSVVSGNDIGIDVIGNASAVIFNVDVVDNEDSGVIAEGSSALVIDDSEIDGNDGNGIEVALASTAEITDTTINGNLGAGVDVANASSAVIGDEDGASGEDVLITNNGEGMRLRVGASAQLVNTTVSGNGGFSAINVQDSQLELAEVATISHPDNSAGSNDYAIFAINGSISAFSSPGLPVPSVTGPNGSGDAAIVMFGFTLLQSQTATISAGGGAGTVALELHNKSIAQRFGGTVTGPIVCFGSFVETFGLAACSTPP